jgi:hypothetical protein
VKHAVHISISADNQGSVDELQYSTRVPVPSSEWGPSNPFPSAAPQDPREGETHFLVGKGVGGPNSDEWTESLVLYVCYNPSPPSSHPQERRSKLKYPVTLFSFFSRNPELLALKVPDKKGYLNPDKHFMMSCISRQTAIQSDRAILYITDTIFKVLHRHIL